MTYYERLETLAEENGGGFVYLVVRDGGGEMRTLAEESSQEAAVDAMHYYYDTSLSEAEQGRIYIRVYCLCIDDVELDDDGGIANMPMWEVASV